MSVCIPKSEMTQEMRSMIQSMLFLQPEEQPQYNKMTKRFGPAVSTKEPIQFYKFDQDYFYIPFKFASALLKKVVNKDLSHPILADMTFTGSLREHQVEPYKEAQEQLKKEQTTTLNLYTSFGKTVIGVSLACELKLHILVLLPRTILIKVWREAFSQHSNATVYAIGEEKESPESFLAQNKPQPSVLICYEERYSKIPKEWLQNIGTLIIDEAHLIWTQSRVAPLLCTQPKYIIAETATLERTDKMEQMMIALLGVHNVCRTKSDKKYTVYKVMTGFKPNVQKTDRGTDYNHLLEQITSNEARNRYIVREIVKKHPGKKILILTVRRGHVDALYKMCKEEGISSLDFIYGGKKTYQNCDVLIGSTVVNTGFDEKDTAIGFDGRRIEILVLTTSIKNETTLNQAVGRSKRGEKPIVYHLIDENPTIKRHWTSNNKWYESDGATVEVLKPVIDYSLVPN